MKSFLAKNEINPLNIETCTNLQVKQLVSYPLLYRFSGEIPFTDNSVTALTKQMLL